MFSQTFIFRWVILPALVFLCLPITAIAQELPKSIRGYKVYVQKNSVSITDSESSKDSSAEISIAEPYLVDVSLAGLTIDLFATLKDVQTAGRVDFLTFQDFRVNGIAVEVEDYVHAFSLRKNEPVRLPKPIRIFVPSQRVLQAAWSQINAPTATWTITGRVFVFGRFRRFGISFKRVIPVDINIAIKNPLTSPPQL